MKVEPFSPRLVWSMLTESWVITMEQLMIPHTILGHPVSNEPVVWCQHAKFTLHAVLDPWISYKGLLTDCENDSSMWWHLEHSRDQLRAHYCANYLRDSSLDTGSTSSMPSIAPGGSPQKVDFTAQYRKWVWAYIDELKEFFKLPQENFDSCDHIKWWAGRRSQFPNLSCLAHDILSIPGL